MNKRQQQWRNLTTVQQRNITLWGLGQVIVRGAALWDLRRRSAHEVRGGKRLWTALLVSFWLMPPPSGKIRGSKGLWVIAVVGSFLMPIAYGLWGRTRR